MKRTGLLLSIIILLIFTACNKDESIDPQYPVSGKLSLTIHLSVDIIEEDIGKKSIHNTDNFKVIIYTSSGDTVLVYENVTDLPAEIELETGEYYVVAHSDSLLPAAFENPYYYGQSSVFTINKEKETSVTVTCELANCMVTVVYSQFVLDNFTSCSTFVSTAGGSLTFLKDETRAGFFELEPISINVVLIYTTSEGAAAKILTGSIDDPQPKKHYEIHVDATLEDGTASMMFNLDESVDTEVVLITDDPGDPPPAVVGYGELLITEIMYDPSALPDNEGEWFEIYNTSTDSINLFSLVIFCNETSSHIIIDSIILGGNEYFVLARNALATIADKYVYGSSIILTNTGSNLVLANYGTDGTDGAEIAGVDYGISGFPTASGASIQLKPENFNADDAKLGSSWTVSTSVFDTGDYGTPGAANVK